MIVRNPFVAIQIALARERPRGRVYDRNRHRIFCPGASSSLPSPRAGRQLGVELLQKLLKGELAARRRKNVVQARSFAEMLERTLLRYRNRAVEAAQVIEELIQLARDLREANARGETLGLSEDECAFYDALETNDSAVQGTPRETPDYVAGYAKAQHRRKRLSRPRRVPPLPDAVRQCLGQPEPAFRRAMQHQPVVRRDRSAREIGDHILGLYGWKIEREKAIFGHGRRGAFVASGR